MNKDLLLMAKNLGYEGDSSTEAKCWIGAIEKGLDMKKEARHQRAKLMGFDIDNVYHHGTANNFDRFDVSKIGKNYSYSENSGFFFTKKLSSAKNYARLHSGDLSDGRVISVFLKFKKPYIVHTNSDYYSPPDRFDIDCFDILHTVDNNENDSVLIHGTNNDDLCIVFDPNQILSIHAAFDPDTENYQPYIHLENSLEKLFLTFNLEKEDGLKEISELAYNYSQQEKENLSINDLKNEFNNIIEYFEYSNEKTIKERIYHAIDNAYDNRTIDHKPKIKLSF